MNDHYQKYIEWEFIDSSEIITSITFENQHYEVNPEATITFSRDEQYKLIATITGLDNTAKVERNHGELGSIIEKENIIGYSRNGLLMYKMDGIVLNGFSRNHNFDLNSTTIKTNIIFDTIEKIHTNNQENTSIIHEWYLCGKPNIVFPRSTMREVEKRYKRIRHSIDNEEDYRKLDSHGSSRDYFLINTTNFSLIVSQVPKLLGPEWAYNLMFEYRETLSPIPDSKIRNTISEFIAFILGHELYKIGESCYDDSYYFTKQSYQNPNGTNIINVCKKMAFTPVNIQIFNKSDTIEILLNNLLPKYLELHEKLKLNSAISKFWLAKYSVLGANLPILSSAVESLAEQILKTHPEKKHYYIKPSEFTKLIEKDLESISNKIDLLNLENPLHKQIILNKINGSSQRGSNEKLLMMFEILNLPIGEVEKLAIRARNKMAHTSFGDITDEEVIDAIRLTRAYESLFNRIILKILSYENDYIDYYTLGFPSRNIDEYIPTPSS